MPCKKQVLFSLRRGPDFSGSMFLIYLSLVHWLPFCILLVLHSFCNLVILLWTWVLKKKTAATDLTMWIPFLLYHAHWSFDVVPRNFKSYIEFIHFALRPKYCQKIIKTKLAFSDYERVFGTPRQKALFCIICSIASWAFIGSKTLQKNVCLAPLGEICLPILLSERG